MKKISEMTPGEALTEQALAVFKRRLEQARKKGRRKRRRHKSGIRCSRGYVHRPGRNPVGGGKRRKSRGGYLLLHRLRRIFRIRHYAGSSRGL